MSNAIPHITVCLCTYQRPTLLPRLLEDLIRQDTQGQFTFSVVVTDNDPGESGRPVVAEISARSQLPISYSTESQRSISHARNTCLKGATGEYIAFIDDDEFPRHDWLLQMYRALIANHCAGVLGAVRPHYMEGTPDWIKKGGFFERLEHETGFVMPWEECRTGNVLFRRAIIEGINPVFRLEFGTGGSDVDFFRRMIAAGHKFTWCNTAPVFEYVLPSRWKRRVLLKRALLRGQNAARHPQNRTFGSLSKSLVAVIVYAIALPFLQLAGHHLFMRYLVKWCDHAGKLLAVVGLNPIKKRAM